MAKANSVVADTKTERRGKVAHCVCICSVAVQNRKMEGAGSISMHVSKCAVISHHTNLIGCGDSMQLRHGLAKKIQKD